MLCSTHDVHWCDCTCDANWPATYVGWPGRCLHSNALAATTAAAVGLDASLIRSAAALNTTAKPHHLAAASPGPLRAMPSPRPISLCWVAIHAIKLHVSAAKQVHVLFQYKHCKQCYCNCCCCCRTTALMQSMCFEQPTAPTSRNTLLQMPLWPGWSSVLAKASRRPSRR